MKQIFNENLELKLLVKKLFDKDAEVKAQSKKYDPYEDDLTAWLKTLKQLKKQRKEIKNELKKLL